MKAIDRVMRAYVRTQSLTAEQTERVRAELSSFIDDLMRGKIAISEPAVGRSKPRAE